jgi:hypothetical protein
VQFGADEAEPLMQPAAVHAGTGRDAGLRKADRDILQDRRVLGQHQPVVGAQRRHQPERVDLPEIGAVVLHDLGLRIDLEIIGLGAGFVQRDAGRQRAGQRREIQIHGMPPWLSVRLLEPGLIFILFRII